MRKVRKGTRNAINKVIGNNEKNSVFGFIGWITLWILPGKYFIRWYRNIKRNISSSWHKSLPEYPLYILAVIVGLLLGIGYLWLFGDKYGTSSSFMTGWLTLSAAPLVLTMWKWRNTHKITEFKIQNRNANEALLLKAGEQLGHDNEVTRLCGIESIDRYARLMMDQDEPDYREFQRAVSMLCGFARQKSAEKKRSSAVKVTQMGDAYGTSGEVLSPEDERNYLVHETDYKSCVDLIFRLMRDYYDELMGCCVFPSDRQLYQIIKSGFLSFPVVDLNNCDMRGFQYSDKYFLVNSNFIGTDFSTSNFTNAKLKWGNFSGSNLINARLRKANLFHADLKNANLSIADLVDANLVDANLVDANLVDAVLFKANLFKANLFKANLKNANFKNANLSSADLGSASLADANLVDAVLFKANLFKANLFKANLFNADLFHANLKNANLKNASLSNASLKNANLKNASLKNASLNDANLSSADLSSADLGSANLFDANLVDAGLFDANLFNANLFNANLKNANLKNAYLENAYLENAVLNKYTVITVEQLKKAKSTRGLRSSLK